jgi:hypothetical protein
VSLVSDGEVTYTHRPYGSSIDRRFLKDLAWRKELDRLE